MDVLITVDHGKIDGSFIQELCLFALNELSLPDDTELSITFVTDEEIAELNETYRGKVGPTDVLSFECDNLEDDFPLPSEEASFTLGDIIIAPDVAARQAIELGETFEEELAVLVIHGILHLMGYDHIEDEEAQVMEERQQALVEAWNLHQDRHQKKGTS